MPLYLPTDVRIRLSASSLYDTTTRTVVDKKGETAARQAEVAQARLKDSAFLNEERVQFPGDTHNFGLNFLNNVPFKQVQVGADLFRVDLETEGHERRASMRSARMQAKWEYNDDMDEKEGAHSIPQRPKRAHPAPSSSLSGAMSASPFADHHEDEMVPKALALHVMLGDQSFLRSYEDGKPQRCMIDVFFNGQLSSSVLVHWKEIHTWHQVFSGIRVGHMAERPWVVLPPGQNANGSLRGLKRSISVNERWQQISSALMQEVKARGVNKYGERPPSADYLHSLATMQMSKAVERLQKPGGRRFGIVDVMITAGDGKKLNNGMSYLKTPMRIVDERYKRRHEEDKRSSRSPEQSSDRNAEGEADGEFEQESPFTPALVPPTPWPTTPLLPSPLLPPTLPGSPQLPQMPLPLPSVLVFPPFPTALPGSSSANTSMQSGPFSSPVLNPQHFLGASQSYNSSSSAPMFSDPIPVLNASYPSLPPTRPRQVSFSHANIASFDPRAPPSDTAAGLGISERAVLPIPNSPSQISPLAHRAADSPTPVLFRDNSFNPPPLGPPPPVGFFSAPISVVDRTMTDSTTVDPNLPPLSILLTRFVITGKLGKRIVDHRWQVAQRIAMKNARSRPKVSLSRSPIRLPTKNRQKSPGSKDYSAATARAGRRSRSRNNHRPTTPPPPSSPTMVDPEMTMSIDKMKRDSIHDGQSIRGPSRPLSRGPTLASISESHPLGARTRLKDNADLFVDNGSAPIPNIPAIVSYRHEHQILPFLGVQGPKTASFIFDNPEEFLRQRARSPAKQDTPPVAVTSHPPQLVSSVEAAVAVISTPRNPTSVSRAFNLLESGGLSISSAPSSRPRNSAPEFQIVNLLESGSSDLSSAPSSPEVALSQTVISAHLSSVPLEDIPGQPLSAVKPPDMLHTSLAYACETLTEEGRRAPSSPSAPSSPKSPEIPLSQTRRAVTVQATSEFAFQPAPQVQPRLTAPRTYISPQKPSTSSTSYTSFTSPTRSKSPSKKKRRITSSSSRSQPRTKIPAPSVDTSKNPPLNQDCVLAFAVTGTVGMEGEERVLRQVKSERQGVFDESEVVCGMRFFVAG